MAKQYEFLNMVFTNQRSTRFYLENVNHKKYKNQIDECIEKGFIEVVGTTEEGDAIYGITELGKKIVDNPKEEI